ncbi:hypothetical protein [Rhodopseudomonas palustris]|uniref:hypothetical protein n=1 Tax=Rhodopseudomonas palustris TaxID=1076 RepID=UPI001401C0FD|nr:hypothetical protein [Rhodopseudomonas palustris]QLH69221.1 hypothetical protein HZF03_13970 [Rhodopseudomonas palustris]
MTSFVDAGLDRQIAAVDKVIQIYEPGHSPRKAAAQRGRKGGQCLGGLFANENLSARILNTLRLAQTRISSHECAIRVALQKVIPEDDPRLPELANRVAISLSGLAKRNRVEQIKGDGRAFLWRVAA